MKSEQVISALGALAQETRLAVFRLLVQAGPEGLAAGEIARRLDVPAATLSFHLKEMDRAGLVESHRESRSIIYSPNFNQVRTVVDYLMDNCCSGSACGVAPARREKETVA